MLAKLAIRNVKRQLGSYLIYFITVTTTIALMFAINNIIFSEELLKKAASLADLKNGLIGITVLISLIVTFILSYATNFMIKLRKREFGLYLTMGMNRRNLLTIFIFETMILSIIALIFGVVIGMGLFQFLMMIISNLMELEITFSVYSMQGSLFTICSVLILFFVSSLSSGIYLKKVKIASLFLGEYAVEKEMKRTGFWFVTAIISLGVLIYSIVQFRNDILAVIENQIESNLFLYLFLATLSLIIFHIAAAKSIVGSLLKNQVFCSKGTNTFLLRQLNGRLKSNSIMMGILAFLIGFAVIGANLSFAQKGMTDSVIERDYPFDINVNLIKGNYYQYDLNAAEEIIQRHVNIEEKVPYFLYESDNNYLHTFTPYNYAELKDMFIKVSDYNKLMELLGKPTVMLKDEFLVLESPTNNFNADFKNAVLNLNGKNYTYQKSIRELGFVYYTYFVTIVPDEAVMKEELVAECAAYDLEDKPFDSVELYDQLSYKYQNGKYEIERCDYRIREFGRLNTQGNAAIFIVGAIYIAVVFVFMAMALLALKTLSQINEDREKYQILHRLGTSSRKQSRTLFKQILLFFLLPFIIPILLSIPVGIITLDLVNIYGLQNKFYSSLMPSLLAVVFISIFILYFTATYFIAKRNIIQE